MILKDLFPILFTDYIILAEFNGKIIEYLDSTHIELSCSNYANREVISIIPLNNKIKITVK